ncbi:MAG: amino acid ABC transporter substrate-binding protein [Clostridiaceae bacterium]|nr:amino acid ABC transporter substrate-binding protein [Clostridiaceae bacterium]
MKNKFFKKGIVAIILSVLAALILLSGCQSLSTGTDDSWEKVKEKGKFVLGLDESFPPMGFTDENGEIVGFDIDVAREVCSRLGIELVLQPINWDAKEQELSSNNIDCIWNGFTITEERKQNVLFSEPYMNNRQIIVVKEDAPYNTMEDLKGKKLGLQSQSSAQDALDAHEDFKKSLGEVVLFDTNTVAIMDLEKGGIDALLVDEIVIRYYMQNKKANFKIFEKELSHEEYGIGFRKKDKKLMQKIQETLNDMAKDGTLAQISIKWFDEDITTVGKK